MNSPYVPAAPETSLTPQSSQLDAPHTLKPQSLSSSNGTGLSPSSTASAVVFLSLFGLAVLASALYWTRRRRTAPKVSDERPSGEEVAVQDVEALAASRPIVPVTPLPDVRWAPQIRSISGPAGDKASDGKSIALPLKRVRSPPPSIKTRISYPDPYAKSAPAHTLSFSQADTPRPPKSARRDASPPVTPRTLAVSGMKSRTLGRLGVESES